MITVTKTYRTSGDLLREIRSHYPDELIEVRCVGRDDRYMPNQLLFLNGQQTQLHFSEYDLTPEVLENDTFGYTGYDELLALLTHEIRREIANRMISRRKEIQIIYDAEPENG